MSACSSMCPKVFATRSDVSDEKSVRAAVEAALSQHHGDKHLTVLGAADARDAAHRPPGLHKAGAKQPWGRRRRFSSPCTLPSHPGAAICLKGIDCATPARNLSSSPCSPTLSSSSPTPPRIGTGVFLPGISHTATSPLSTPCAAAAVTASPAGVPAARTPATRTEHVRTRRQDHAHPPPLTDHWETARASPAARAARAAPEQRRAAPLAPLSRLELPDAAMPDPADGAAADLHAQLLAQAVVELAALQRAGAGAGGDAHCVPAISGGLLTTTPQLLSPAFHMHGTPDSCACGDPSCRALHLHAPAPGDGVRRNAGLQPSLSACGLADHHRSSFGDSYSHGCAPKPIPLRPMTFWPASAPLRHLSLPTLPDSPDTAAAAAACASHPLPGADYATNADLHLPLGLLQQLGLDEPSPGFGMGASAAAAAAAPPPLLSPLFPAPASASTAVLQSLLSPSLLPQQQHGYLPASCGPSSVLGTPPQAHQEELRMHSLAGLMSSSPGSCWSTPRADLLSLPEQLMVEVLAQLQ